MGRFFAARGVPLSGPLKLGVPFPSGPPQAQKLQSALAWLDRWEVDVTCPWNQRAREAQYDYLAGPDPERVAELLGMLNNPELEVLWCGRGGFGATRILSQLNAEPRPLCQTRLLGYSDITALFGWVYSQALPVECVHSPILCEIPEHPQPDLVWSALSGTPPELEILDSDDGLASFKGPIWGGNLAVMASLAGTPWLPCLKGHALLVEDIDESPYRLDRYLTQLVESGQLGGNLGVLLGSFTNCGDPARTKQLVKTRCQELGLRVLAEVPVGHQPHHVPVFLGREYAYHANSATLRAKG